MTFRSLATAAIAISCLPGLTLPGLARAASREPSASFRPQAPAPAVEARVSAYRQYAKEQADTLVDMTGGLARAIKAGYLDSARMTYIQAHVYLARIAPVAQALGDLDRSMDARAGAYEQREADPRFSGFHRLEYGLFVDKSVAGLSDVADWLARDARALRERLATLDVTPAMLLDGTIGNLHTIADDSLSGDAERYARTDLWDFAANVEGAKQVLAALGPQAKPAVTPDPAALRLAEIERLLETHKAGCGFQYYDEVGRAERAALKAPIVALAEALTRMRGGGATD